MNGLIVPIVYVLAFVAVVLLCQTVAGLFFSASERGQRINRRLTMLESGMDRDQVYSALVRRPGATTGLPRLYEIVDNYCRQAGLTIAPPVLIGGVAGAVAVLWIVSLFIFRAGSAGSLLVEGLLSLIGSTLICVLGAWVFVSGRRTARMRKFEEQLPLALDIITRAIRAGHPVISAVQLAAAEMGDPLGSEFGLIVDETTYGFEFKEALTHFARRTGSPDAHYFAVCVGVQSETGGNLAEILEGLAGVVRGRATLRKRIKALSSEGRASALVLSALPIVLIASMMLLRPEFYTSKFSDPIFWPVISGVVLLYLAGWAMIHRIVNFKY